MIDELGQFALVLGFCLSLAQMALSFAGRWRRDAVLTGAGEGAALGAFLSLAFAFGALIHAFVVSDFSVMNVAANSHTEKPMLYKVAGAWGSHEGSILLWCFALTGYGAAVALSRGLPFGLKALTVAVQGTLGSLFVGYMLFASNPLLRIALPPVEGHSLNPLLQDPALAAHPPFLYAGYVGFSVVFSLAAAALIEGRVDAAWARWVRPWALGAWSLLTIGITLGSFWAYYELGWGGWWFWDPVENASFMPWLLGTALLHSAIVTEKRGGFPAWTAFLGMGCFTLSMLGAFLVRSGVLTSVHAFAVDPKRGILLLGILALAAGSGFALFAWRAPRLKDPATFAPISRESTLFINNILLSAVTVTVLLGTLYPLLKEAVTGEAVSVGPPFFNLTFVPLMVTAFLILPAGPLLAWKRGDAAAVVQRLVPAVIAAAAAGLLCLAVVSPRKALASFGVGLGAWLIAGALDEIAERVRLFRAPLAESGRRLGGLPRGAWGMSLAHIGLGVFVMGAAFESAWKVEAAETRPIGGVVALGDYRLTLQDVSPRPGPNYDAEHARILVTDAAGAVACTAEPERRTYDSGGQTTSEVAICAKGADDIYVVLGERRIADAGASQWLIRAYWNPWARLLFFGPVLMALGGAISLSDRRLRFAVGRRARARTAGPATPSVAGPSPEPAE
ncbi:heme lyase CcmF/NrfE family subunit [Caulobacter sp. KR2-114]|uniref:heme lyase CcmF/NrfE family subunit n=1 Tax=Caulobacter sp. KR2-114 TaxID=3400912 RepID=UPI003C0CCDD4